MGGITNVVLTVSMNGTVIPMIVAQVLVNLDTTDLTIAEVDVEVVEIARGAVAHPVKPANQITAMRTMLVHVIHDTVKPSQRQAQLRKKRRCELTTRSLHRQSLAVRRMHAERHDVEC